MSLATTTPNAPEMLRAGAVLSDSSIGVDQANRVINGFVVAQTGDFKDKRGSFDESSLDRIVELGNQSTGGLRSRLSHPNESDDGVTKHLGRVRNFRRDGDKVRADLHVSDVAMQEPVGGGKPLGQYVMQLASEDPGALSSSLVLRKKTLARKDDDGNRLPDKWTPTELMASDIVSDGDAVHGDLLSVKALDSFMEGSGRRIPTKLAIAGAQFLDQAFPDGNRELIETRFTGFLNNYLSHRFGADTDEETEMDEATQEALAAQDSKIELLSKQLTDLGEMLRADIESRQQESLATSRAAEIAALCKQAEYPDAEQLIADEKLSVDDARKKVFDWKCSQNASLGTGSANGNEPKTEIEKIRAKWDAEKESQLAAGYEDRETWVRHQCRDANIEYTEPSAAA